MVVDFFCYLSYFVLTPLHPHIVCLLHFSRHFLLAHPLSHHRLDLHYFSSILSFLFWYSLIFFFIEKCESRSRRHALSFVMIPLVFLNSTLFLHPFMLPISLRFLKHSPWPIIMVILNNQIHSCIFRLPDLFITCRHYFFSFVHAPRGLCPNRPQLRHGRWRPLYSIVYCFPLIKNVARKGFFKLT